jgi:hypothetical protein
MQHQGNQQTHCQPALGCIHGCGGSCRGGIRHAGRVASGDENMKCCWIDSTAYTRQ